MDFFKELNSKIISDNYDVNYFNDILNIIKKEYMADKVFFVSNFSNRKNDNIFYSNSSILKNDVVLSVYDNIKLVIRNNKKDICNPDVLVSILNNVFKVYYLIEKLKQDKHTDGLLKIKNRHAYEELVNKKAKFYNVGIAFVDANGLGIINNKHSYEKGDELLRTVSKSLTDYFRDSNVYRIGGDEFVVICPDIDKNLFYEKIKKGQDYLKTTEFSASYGVIYCKSTSKLKKKVEVASHLMKKYKEHYREMHPEEYLDKYKIKHDN